MKMTGSKTYTILLGFSTFTTDCLTGMARSTQSTVRHCTQQRCAPTQKDPVKLAFLSKKLIYTNLRTLLESRSEVA